MPLGGLEAESVLLRDGSIMDIPQTTGVILKNKMLPSVTVTDLVLTITNILREKNVVDQFVEFVGDGLRSLPVPHRATIANMAPDYGATCGFFPIDQHTISYIKMIGKTHGKLVEQYAKAQGLFYTDDYTPEYDNIIEIDLSTIETTISGPKRPQDKISIIDVPQNFKDNFPTINKTTSIKNGDIVIASITSCTNTSNPFVMFAAALLARNAIEKGLSIPKHVKTSFAPGSRMVQEYLQNANLLKWMEDLGFHIIGYGCTTCTGNSGKLNDDIDELISKHRLSVCSLLSGNRNFESRIHPLVKANYLASPPLVIAYGLLGNITKNIYSSSLGKNQGKDVFLKDIWPLEEEINKYVDQFVTPDIFSKTYLKNKHQNLDLWSQLPSAANQQFTWDTKSTYIRKPDFFSPPSEKYKNMRILVMLGDSITTDHISPVGTIVSSSPAGKYLLQHDVSPKQFNSYGTRRGNFEVMQRGTFANPQLLNEIIGYPSPNTLKFPDNIELSVYDAAVLYKKEDTALVVIAGKEYGTGSSRDWAAKGPALLGVKCIIAESFERIHRSNLIRMGIIPLTFPKNTTRKTLGLTGREHVSLELDLQNLKPHDKVKCLCKLQEQAIVIVLQSEIYNNYEIQLMQQGGIFNYFLKSAS